MKRIHVVAIMLILLPVPGNIFAREFDSIFRDAVMRTDTSTYRYSTHNLTYRGESYLWFRFGMEEKTAEFELYPRDMKAVDTLSVIPSGDFTIIDSLLEVNGEYYRCKVRFNALTTAEFLKLSLAYRDTGMAAPVITQLRLFPVTSTFAEIRPQTDELFIGEEKVFEIITNNAANIITTGKWEKAGGLNYRVTRSAGRLLLHIIPEATGDRTLNLRLRSRRPCLDDSLRPVFELPPVTHDFTVKRSRLQFINIDRREVTLDDSTRREGIEVQADNSSLMRMQKTYRVEDRESPGGTLIAEIFTRNPLGNDRSLCWLRVYNLHRESEGYLYIKDGDQAQFITNFNITPRTQISGIQILRNGRWSNDLSVHPGETIELKIDGQGLQKANFVFEELEDLSTDTLIQSENMLRFRYRVPMNVSKKRLMLFDRGRNTGKSLAVEEYQEPRPFDFIWINVDGNKQTLNGLPQTILVDKTIPDVLFGADRRVIDSGEKMYGKQYLTMQITVNGKNGQLIEMKTIDDIVVCPGVNSPRFGHYGDEECGPVYFGLNDYLRKKTHQLDIWSKITVKISHRKDKYDQKGYEKEVEIILKKDVSFDIDLSFPAGLITVSKPDPESGNGKLGSLSGISVAMIAQFTFYQPEKINTPKPYKIGAGFLAMNTFNFSADNAERDLGIVLIGSLYPTTKDVKLTFPLYVGGGYFLQKEKLFFLVGPGIRIRF